MRTTPSEVAPPVLHGRHLNEVSVSTVAELTAAVGNSAVDKILVAAGTYSFTTSCDVQVYHRFTICIDRALTIEAEVPGAVVLIATPWKRAFAIQSGGTVELIGLNITGGLALSRGGGVYVASNGVANFQGCNIHDNTHIWKGGGLDIEGQATLTNCNIYDNDAPLGGGVYVKGVANFVGCNIHDNTAGKRHTYRIPVVMPFEPTHM